MMDPTVLGLIQVIARQERIIQQMEAENTELRAKLAETESDPGSQ